MRMWSSETVNPISGKADRKQRLLDTGLALLLSAAVAGLFYRSLWGFLSAVFLIPYVRRMRDRARSRKRDEEILTQFRSAMHSVSGSLQAGYSAEGAWSEAERDLQNLYGRQSVLCRAFAQMNYHVRMNEPLEKELSFFADQTGLEDICSFAEIFSYAKRSGGNMPEIIRATIRRMDEKAEVEEEIKTAVTAKRTEQKLLMLLVPGILAFISFGSPDYASAFYHNPIGVLVMSASLAGYLAAVRWGERIVDIRV